MAAMVVAALAVVAALVVAVVVQAIAMMALALLALMISIDHPKISVLFSSIAIVLAVVAIFTYGERMI